MLKKIFGEIFNRARRNRRNSSAEEPGPRLHRQRHLDEIRRALGLGRADQALAAARRALHADPHNADFHYHEALAHFLLGSERDAQASLELALQLDESSYDAHLLMGAICQKQSSLADALAHYQHAAQARPADPALPGYSGNVLLMLGRYREALASYRKSLELDPDNPVMQSNLLLAMNSSPEIGRAELYEAHRRWGKRVEDALASERIAHGNDRDSERPLRVGYVSADFRDHSVARFVEPFWVRIDRDAFRTCVYDNHSGQLDAVALRMQGRADDWHRIAALSDAQAAQLIREHRIDILVDLSGHTAGNRLGVFARKPAPVQVSWLAYMNTTGLETIDYRITDDFLNPPGDNGRYYSETLFRIPCVACFEPPSDCPAVNALPSLKNGYVTFASFNNWTKISPPVIASWCRILSAVPHARLLIVARGGDDPGVRADILRQFSSGEIDPGRLSIRGTRPLNEFLSMFHEVDIALDPFPYNGGTTSLHALWMGVPIVTLQGAGEISRCGASYLSSAGIPQLIASNVDEYCAIATRLAENPGGLGQMRQELRNRMSAAPIMQAGSLARAMQCAFRAMWRNYVEGNRSRLTVPAVP